MQRILSLETSRLSSSMNNSGGGGGGNSNPSQLVTKRLCCSFILTVAFFAVIGGFVLGRFVVDRSLQQARHDLRQITAQLHRFDVNLRHYVAQYDNLKLCAHLRGVDTTNTTQTDDVTSDNDDDQSVLPTTTVLQLLDTLNECVTTADEYG